MIAMFTLSTSTLAAVVGPAGPTWPAISTAEVDSFFAGVAYDPAVPTPESVLGFALGSRPVRYDEAIRYLQALADFSPRVDMVPMGHTHEGRTLYYLVLGSEQKVADRERLRGNMSSLANPPQSGVVPNLDQLIRETPTFVWLAYSIHGDELSGVDASLWTAYHVAAANDDAAKRVRDSVLVFIDPIQNPDGRERYLAQVFAFNGRVFNSDGQSLQHDGFWPWGRANHYLFDMNRDWLPLVHPETQARVAALNQWNPQVVVDAHEMGAYSTYLFSPGREPINLNIVPAIHKWWDVFAADQGAEFDRRGWSYYTGDWHEEWYPGYGSAWCLYMGAIGILYEQAGVAGSGVKRDDGSVLSYAQAVAQQTVSSLANLQTAARNRTGLLSDYARFHREAVTGSGPHPNGAYVLAPSGNDGREQEFLTTVLRHGVRVERSQAAFSANARTAKGGNANKKFPAGSYLISLQQSHGPLIHALMEFDPHLKPEFLEEERRELEKGNGTRLYEVSGWSMAQGYNLDVSYISAMPGVATDVVDNVNPPPGEVTNPNAAFGFILPTTDDRSMVALTRALESGLSVRAAPKPFVHDGTAYAAGTSLLRRAENPSDLTARLTEIARSTGVRFIGAGSNYSVSGPDLGSDMFQLVRPPRIGLFMGTGIDFTSAGFVWYLLDQRLGIRNSLLDITQLSRYDLSAYNVLIMPSHWGGAGGLKTELGPSGIESLRNWVEAGGTLIAIGEAAYFCADSANNLSSAREKGSVLDKLAEYDQAYQEERAAFTATVDSNAIWKGPPAKLSEKKESKPLEKPDMDELKRRDEKARTFFPQGLILRLELNPEHWLAFGCGDSPGAMIYSSRALLAKDPVAIPARLADEAHMRLSGLLWPEARERWAKTAYATRESKGKGQIILFADDPFFRAYFHGTKRLLENAVLLGPGMGTQQPPPW